jgi:hypothetical protein
MNVARNSSDVLFVSRACSCAGVRVRNPFRHMRQMPQAHMTKTRAVTKLCIAGVREVGKKITSADMMVRATCPRVSIRFAAVDVIMVVSAAEQCAVASLHDKQFASDPEKIDPLKEGQSLRSSAQAVFQSPLQCRWCGAAVSVVMASTRGSKRVAWRAKRSSLQAPKKQAKALRRQFRQYERVRPRYVGLTCSGNHLRRRPVQAGRGRCREPWEAFDAFACCSVVVTGRACLRPVTP